MKLLSLKLLFILLAINSKSYCQETISQVLATKIPATDEIAWIYDLDVFRYYYKELNIKDNYNTPLQRQVYMQSDDYNKKLNELKKLKSELDNKYFYLELSSVEEFFHYTGTRTASYGFNSYKFIINDYNVESKGFEFQLWNNHYYIYEDMEIKGEAAYSREVELGVKPFPLSVRRDLNDNSDYDGNKIILNDFIYVLLKGLPILKKVPASANSVPLEFLFVPVAEQAAVEVERQRKDVMLYIIFRPTEKEIVNSKHGRYNYNDIILSTSNESRLIVANSVTGKIYFDKTYQ